MHTRVISTTVTNPVVLGTGGYGNHLTITSTGAVEPVAYGATAITGPAGLAGAHIHNLGTVAGGAGASNGYLGDNAGDGIVLLSGGVIANAGIISGGQGGYTLRQYSGTGGTGVQLDQEGTVTNNGTMAGGAGGGGYQGDFGASGGIGVELAQGGVLVNHGLISGGTGGPGYYVGGGGGNGVQLGAWADVTNSGTISAGGAGYYDGQSPVAQAVAQAVTQAPNHFGTGGAGIYFEAGGVLTNRGVIGGGYSNAYFGGGGAGVMFAAAGTVSNSGTIFGGSGAAGVDLAQGGALTNTGSITGGMGYYLPYNTGGTGGTGIVMAGPGMLANSGTISGGAGGRAGYADNGAGGIGVALQAGTLTNTGSITGGIGISYAAGVSVGVLIDGATLVAMGGTISGGAPEYGNHGFVQGDAVLFGSTAGTLAVDPKAVFSGAIVANAAASDALILQGSTPGTMAGFGTTVTGFTTIDIAAGAHWTLEGTISGAGTLAIGTGAEVTLQGAVSIASLLFASGGYATARLTAPTQLTSIISGFGSGDKVDLESIKAASLSYSQGTLTLFNASGNIVDTLGFAGAYTNADFALQSVSNGTDLLYAGTTAGPAAIPPLQEHAAFSGAFGFEELRNDVFEGWHSWVG